MGMVLIKQVARELGINKDYALRLLKKNSANLGITLHSGKRNAISMSREDADRFIEQYNSHRRSRTPVSVALKNIDRHLGYGYFYLIQLHPEDLPTRVKIGYTDDLNVRLSDHRTNAPTLKLLASWPCKRTWEEVAKASITRKNCKRVGEGGSEVFDGDIQGFTDRANEFFELMPKHK